MENEKIDSLKILNNELSKTQKQRESERNEFIKRRTEPVAQPGTEFYTPLEKYIKKLLGD